MTVALPLTPGPPTCAAPSGPNDPSRPPARFPPRHAAQLRAEKALRRGLIWKISGPDKDRDEDLDTESPWWALQLTIPDAPLSCPAEPPPGTANTLIAQEGRLMLRCSRGGLQLSDDRLIALLTGIALPRTTDTAVREGLLKLACALWPTSISEALGSVLDVSPVSDIGQEALQAPIRAALALIARDGARHIVAVEATAESWSAITRHPGWAPMPLTNPLPPAIAAITLLLGLHLGRWSVSRSTVSRLRVGDALWLPAGHASEVRPLCCISGRQLLHLGQVNHLSREFQGWGAKGSQGSNSPHAFPPPTEPRNVDALTVDLDFIVGRVALTVGELSALAPGHVIELESTTPAHVRIVAHGTELGSGQLVDVDGRLAIEILQWGTPR